MGLTTGAGGRRTKFKAVLVSVESGVADSERADSLSERSIEADCTVGKKDLVVVAFNPEAHSLS
jgi:hypothetical protein